MQSLTESVYKLAPPGGIFDETVVRNLFDQKSESARKVLVHRAVEKGEVLRLKPGLYCLAKIYRNSHLHPFSIAGILHAPSYISLESALQYHGLIPEAVFQVTSVTSQRSRSFKTPLGVFSFQRVPTSNLKAGVKFEKLDKISWAFVASELRAIADVVYLNRKVKWTQDGLDFLIESMRMEFEDLRQISFEQFELIYKNIRNKRVKAFLEGLKMEIAR